MRGFRCPTPILRPSVPERHLKLFDNAMGAVRSTHDLTFCLAQANIMMMPGSD